jgi:hypothetical protein
VRADVLQLTSIITFTLVDVAGRGVILDKVKIIPIPQEAIPETAHRERASPSGNLAGPFIMSSQASAQAKRPYLDPYGPIRRGGGKTANRPRPGGLR